MGNKYIIKRGVLLTIFRLFFILTEVIIFTRKG